MQLDKMESCFAVAHLSKISIYLCILLLTGCNIASDSEVAQGDNVALEEALITSITAPTTEETYLALTDTFALSGSATGKSGISTITWRTDKGDSGTATFTTGVTTDWSIGSGSFVLSEGTTNISVTTTDNQNYSHTDSLKISYTPDTAPPELAITSPTSTETYITTATSLTFSGTASDNVAIKTLTWRTDRNDEGTVSFSSGEKSTAWVIDSLSFPIGDTTLYVTATDNAGNTTEESLIVTVNGMVSDEIPPSAPSGIQHETLNHNAVTVTWTESVDNIAVSGYRIYLDGTEIDTTSNTSYTISGLVSGTTYSVSVSAYDAAGNESERSTFLNLITVDPQRLAIEDLQFTGAFRLKNGIYGDSELNYAVGTLAYNPGRHSLFVVGHEHQSAIAEYPIPTPGTQELVVDLPESGEPLQPFANVLDTMENGNPDNLDKITGMLVVGDQLIINAETWYDAATDNTHTTLKIDANNLGSVPGGSYRLEGGAHSAGYMAPIPENYRAAFGADYLTGWSSVYSIISRYSVGPSLWTFSSSDVLNAGAGDSIFATAFMNFPFDDHMIDPRATEWAQQGQAGPFEPASPLWNPLSKGIVGFIVPGTTTFAVFGSNAGLTNGIGYKAVQDNGYECPGPCPYTAGDQYNYYWFFDVDEILAASDVYEPRPYAYGKWSIPYDKNGEHLIIGGTFDDVTNTLYLALDGAAIVETYEKPPLIVTFKIP